MGIWNLLAAKSILICKFSHLQTHSNVLLYSISVPSKYTENALGSKVFFSNWQVEQLSGSGIR